MLQESEHEAVREQQALQRQQAEEEEESDEEEEEHGREAGDSRIFCSLRVCSKPALHWYPSGKACALYSSVVIWADPKTCAAGRPAAGLDPQPSGEDMATSQENKDILVSIMRAQFLSGEDTSVDYRDIDNDASLDDDWAAQADQDAQDKYFEAD